jgi:hypothetical protein
MEPFAKGDRLTAAQMNQIVAALEELRFIRGGGPILVNRTGQGYTISLSVAALLPLLPKPDAGFWAKVTRSVPGTCKYTFEEAVPDYIASNTVQWKALSGGRTGTAYTEGATSDTAVVWIREGVLSDGSLVYSFQ